MSISDVICKPSEDKFIRRVTITFLLRERERERERERKRERERERERQRETERERRNVHFHFVLVYGAVFFFFKKIFKVCLLKEKDDVSISLGG